MNNLTLGFVWLFAFIIPWENLVIFTGFGTISKMIGLFAAIFGLIIVIKQEKLHWHPFLTFGCIFIAWSWTTIFWSIEPQVTLSRALTYSELLIAGWLIYQFAFKKQISIKLMWAYVLGNWIAIFATLSSYLQGIQVTYQRFVARGFDPNDLSIYIDFGIAIAWYVGLRARKSGLKVIAWCTIPAAIFAVLLTASRAGAIGCIFALIFVVLSIRGLSWKWRLAVIILVFGTCWVLITQIPQSNYARLATIEYELRMGTYNERIPTWKAGWELFIKNPFLGFGAGTFRYAVATSLGIVKAPHNVFLAMAVEEGLMGFILWLGLMFTAFRGIIRLPTLDRQVWLILLAILLLAFLSLNFEWRKATWLILAFAAAARSNHVPEKASLPPREVESI